MDLHNNAVLEKISFFIADMTLVFGFRYCRDWREIDLLGSPVDLEFGNVTNLRITQASDYDVRSAGTLEGIIREIQSEESRFIVDVGDVKCEFNAQSVALRMR
ncbi:hypothetical protein [Frankia sp. Cr2]|uniref:hypothetical protein n=1 Tax=Frankia sp. Cr2 TaxID=3073932 RepID=UPI002AD1E0EA|nr:hypothetical protein [Frankia sp. Cr2]